VEEVMRLRGQQPLRAAEAAPPATVERVDGGPVRARNAA
jgi:hypothetical protein